MILKASERGNAAELAQHLLKTVENEHVELHDIRGFAVDDLRGAMLEVGAIARGTRCRNFLFSLSLNSPENEDVSIEVFEAAISRVEGQFGLTGQPRAIVFHEKEGSRHAHAVWSRIDGQEMKAINLPHFKRTLNGIARDLYLVHGRDLPKGFVDRRERDPLTFTRDEWQQARRAKQDPKAIKAQFKECWAASDTKQAFETALCERGHFLARGDRRGFVAVDWRGEVCSLSRYTGVKVKELKAQLGDPNALQSTDQAKLWIAERMGAKLKARAKEVEARAEKKNLASQFQREQMVQRHRAARNQIKRSQEQQFQKEQRTRQDRLPTGMRAVWGWVTGRNLKIRHANEAEIARSAARDRAERQNTIRK